MLITKSPHSKPIPPLFWAFHEDLSLWASFAVAKIALQRFLMMRMVIPHFRSGLGILFSIHVILKNVLSIMRHHWFAFSVFLWVSFRHFLDFDCYNFVDI
jgi:hypothetical protein